MPPPRQGQQRPPRRYRRPPPDASRRLAFEVLRAVHERDAYANLVLPGLLTERALDTRDAALATELTYGTLRGLGSYDAVLAECVDRPLDVVDPPVLDVLRLGAHQLLATRIPAHAAVAATVELARGVLGDGRAKFVNAVLRRVAARDLDGWMTAVAPDRDRDPVGYLAVVHSHPRWVVSAIRDAVGGGLEDTAAFLAADNVRPRVTLAAWPGRSTVAELLEAGGEPGRWSPYAVLLPDGDPADLAAIRERRAGVQDEGSQLVALALARAGLAGVPDRRWLDLCAGPGGKAALLAGIAGERGGAVLASEVQPHRARLVARALTTAPGDHLVVAADGREPAWRPGSFDRVLVDAPCTGMGAFRRRPEARWRRRPEDVPQLAALQRELLGTALDAVRPGGVVAYVTCSPHLAETRVVVGAVLKRRDDVERLDARPLLPGVPDLGSGPDVQLWPHRHGTDAMYLALLRRR
jgi:16S rRNA (cytosine967-C5)-methyltransferase